MEPANNMDISYLFGQLGIREMIASHLNPKDISALRLCNRDLRVKIDQNEAAWQNTFRAKDIGFVPAFAPTWVEFRKKHIRIFNNIELASKNKPFDRAELTSFLVIPILRKDDLPLLIPAMNAVGPAKREMIDFGDANVFDLGQYIFLHYFNTFEDQDHIVTIFKPHVTGVRVGTIPANSTVSIHGGGLVCAEAPDGMLQYFHIKTMEKVGELFKTNRPIRQSQQESVSRKPRVRPRPIRGGQCVII